MQAGTKARRYSILLVLLLLPGSLAQAELQNVIINGYYAQNDPDRRVQVSEILPPQQIWLLEQNPLGTRSSNSLMTMIQVPEQPKVNAYQDQVRVALFFYVKRGPSAEPDPSLECIVKLNSHQAAFFRAPDEWQPRVVDLDLWLGEEVRLDIWGAWLEHSPQSLMIALPRLLVWHGPYYEGRGGLGSPGPHRMPIMPKLGQLQGHSGHWREFRVAPEAMTGAPLLMARVDCVRPTTLHLQSEVQDYRAALNRGYHWLPLRLGNPPKALLQNVDGVMERGPLDVIPDFTLGDEERLRELEAQRTAPPATE